MYIVYKCTIMVTLILAHGFVMQENIKMLTYSVGMNVYIHVMCVHECPCMMVHQGC